MSFLMTPGWDTGFTICHWKATTGTPCLACGLTHAFVFFAHGEFGSALEANPLVFLLYPGFLVGLIWSIGCATGRMKGPARPPTWLLVLLLVLLTLGWTARIVWG